MPTTRLTRAATRTTSAGVKARRSVAVRALGAIAILFTALSLGPNVVLNGVDTGVPGIWAVLHSVPVLNSAVPTRWAMAIAPVVDGRALKDVLDDTVRAKTAFVSAYRPGETDVQWTDDPADLRVDPARGMGGGRMGGRGGLNGPDVPDTLPFDKGEPSGPFAALCAVEH